MGSMMENIMSWLSQCFGWWCNDQKRCQWWQLNVPLPSQPPSYILRHRMTKGSPRVTWRKTVAMRTRSGAPTACTPNPLPHPLSPHIALFHLLHTLLPRALLDDSFQPNQRLTHTELVLNWLLNGMMTIRYYKVTKFKGIFSNEIMLSYLDGRKKGLGFTPVLVCTYLPH